MPSNVAVLTGKYQHEQDIDTVPYTRELVMSPEGEILQEYALHSIDVKPTLEEAMRYRRSDQAEAPDCVSDEELAMVIYRFHATEDTSAVCLQSFEITMNRLYEYRNIRAELLSRAFQEHFMNGWRPINEQETEVLTGWLRQINSRPVYEKVLAAQEQEGVQYTDYEYRGKIARLAAFAGSLLSQERGWRNHLRRQSREPAQPRSAIFPEIANA